ARGAVARVSAGTCGAAGPTAGRLFCDCPFRVDSVWDMVPPFGRECAIRDSRLAILHYRRALRVACRVCERSELQLDIEQPDAGLDGQTVETVAGESGEVVVAELQRETPLQDHTHGHVGVEPDPIPLLGEAVAMDLPIERSDLRSDIRLTLRMSA